MEINLYKINMPEDEYEGGFLGCNIGNNVIINMVHGDNALLGLVQLVRKLEEGSGDCIKLYFEHSIISYTPKRTGWKKKMLEMIKNEMEPRTFDSKHLHAYSHGDKFEVVIRRPVD